MSIFSDLLETVVENPLTALAVVGGTITTGGLAFVAVPGIAAGTAVVAGAEA